MSTFLALLLLITGTTLSGCATTPSIDSAAFDRLVSSTIDLHGEDILFKSHWSSGSSRQYKDALVSTKAEIVLLRWQPTRGRYIETERLAYSKISSASFKSEFLNTHIVITKHGRTASRLILYPSSYRWADYESSGKALHAYISEQLERSRHLPGREGIEPVIIGIAVARSRGDIGLGADELNRGAVARAEQGAGVGAAPGGILGQLGGGIIAIPVAVVGGVIGGAAGSIIGGFEDLTTDAPARRARAEAIRSRLASALSSFSQDTLRDCILEYVEESSSGYVVEEIPAEIKTKDRYIFISVKNYNPADQYSDKYWHIIHGKERLTDLLEVVIETVEFAPRQGAKARSLEQQKFTLGIKAYFKVTTRTSQTSFFGFNTPYLSAKTEAISSPYLLSEWLADNGRKAREEYLRACSSTGEQVVEKFLSSYPNPATLQE